MSAWKAQCGREESLPLGEGQKTGPNTRRWGRKKSLRATGHVARAKARLLL